MFNTQISSTILNPTVNYIFNSAIKAKQRHGYDIINGFNKL